MKTLITADLVKGYVGHPPASTTWVYDTRLPGFALVARPSGAHSYIFRVARGRSVTVGPVAAWSPDQARTEAREIRRRVDRGEPPTAKVAAKASVTLRAFLTDTYEPWLAAHRKRAGRKSREIRTAFASLLDTPLAEITPFALERWRKARLAGEAAAVTDPAAEPVKTKKKARQKTVTHATCNRELAELKAMFSRAVTWGQAHTNPGKALKLTREDHSRVRYLTAEEEARLRKALTARDTKAQTQRANANAWRAARGYATRPAIGAYRDALTPLVLTALNTGLRRGELLSLTWGAVNLVRGQLTVQAAHAKSGKTRHVPLNTEAREVLTAWRPSAWTPEALVFPADTPSANGEARQIQETKTAWTGLLKAADITGFRFHDLRHTFASKLVMRGVDLNTVRELLGHADLTMTLRYAHLAPEHLDAAVEKLVSA